MILSARWFIREFRLELLVLLFAVLIALYPQPVWAQALYEVCSIPVPTASPTIPQGVAVEDSAFFASETIAPEYQPPQQMADVGFSYLVGMLNVVTVHPCDRGRAATVELKALRIIRKDPNTGYETVEQLVTFGNGWNLPNGLVYKTFYRQPVFFTSGEPATQPTLASIAKQTYTVNVKSIPRGIYHAWTNPRVPTIAGHPYFVEVVVRVTGDARIQLGMDYWRGSVSDYNGWTPGCTGSNNCQAWLSNWLGDTKGKFVTWRAPSMVF